MKERFFDPNCEEISNAFVRPSKFRIRISDLDYYDDDYYFTESNRLVCQYV